VRHGITESNNARQFAGHTDVELNATGHKQAERLRDRLADNKIDAIYSSDLKRALVTAEIISAGHKLDIVTCPELREINYGDIEGLTFEKINRLYPEVAESLTNFRPQLSFPGGESFEEFTERACKFLDRLKRHTPSQTILIVSHGGLLRVLVCHLTGVKLTHWRLLHFDNASLSIVETHSQTATINLLNDTSHLKGIAQGDWK